MTISRLTTVVVAVLCLASPSIVAAVAHAQRTAPADHAPLVVRPEVLARVEQLLMAIDSTAPASAWSALGGDGLAALVTILDDGARPVGLRRRAVFALRHHPGAGTFALLASLASRTTEDEIVSRNALRVLAELRGREALLVIESALRDPRAHVREGAVQAIASLRERRAIDAADARTRLLAMRAAEPARFVQVAIDRALASRPSE